MDDTSRKAVSSKTLRKKLIQHSISHTVAGIIGMIASLVLVKILTSTVSQESYGTFSMWKYFVTLCSILSTSIFSKSLLRYFQRRKINGKSGASRLLVASLFGSWLLIIISFLCILIAYLVTGIQLVPDTLYLVSLMAALLIVISYVAERIVLNVADAEQKPRDSLMFRASYAAVPVTISSIFAFISQDYSLALLGFGIGHIIPASVSVLKTFREYGISIPNSSDFKQIVSYGGAGIVEDFVVAATPFVVSFLISFSTNIVDVSIFSVAITVAGFWTFAVAPFFQAYQAYLIRSFEIGNFSKGQQTTNLLLRAFLISAPLAGGLLIQGAPLIIRLISTDAYLPAVEIIPFTVIGAIFISMSHFWRYRLRLAEDVPRVAVASFISLMTLIITGIIIIPIYGILGVGIAILLKSLVELILMVLQVKSKLQMKLKHSIIFKLGLGILVYIVSYCSLYIFSLDWWLLLVIPGSLYGTTILALRVVRFQEIRQIVGLLLREQ